MRHRRAAALCARLPRPCAPTGNAGCLGSSSITSVLAAGPLGLLVQLLAQSGVVGLEFEYGGDSGQVEPTGEQLADAHQTGKVVLAVQPGAALGALRLEESALLIGAEVLDPGADDVGSNGDAVDAPGRIVLSHLSQAGRSNKLALASAFDWCYKKSIVVSIPLGNNIATVLEVTTMLVRTDPFRDFDRLAQQLLGNGTTSRPAIMPMDARREGDLFVLEFDLPGVQSETIDIDVERNVLTIRAERPANTGDWEPLAAERPRGLFSRQLVLGENLDLEQIDAGYDTGVLTLRIPIAEKAKPRKVAVSTGTSSEQPALNR
jgi:HSP20 family protein